MVLLLQGSILSACADTGHPAHDPCRHALPCPTGTDDVAPLHVERKPDTGEAGAGKWDAMRTSPQFPMDLGIDAVAPRIPPLLGDADEPMASDADDESFAVRCTPWLTLACDDGLACTVGDTCRRGQCTGTLKRGACLIDGQCVRDTAFSGPSGNGLCRRCLPGFNPRGWTIEIGRLCAGANTTAPHHCDAAGACVARFVTLHAPGGGHEDGVVDRLSGLRWQRAVISAHPEQSHASPAALTHTKAREKCATIPVGGSGRHWRLPTIDELRGLIVACPLTPPQGECPIREGAARGPVTPESCLGCVARGAFDGKEGIFLPEGVFQLDGASVLWSDTTATNDATWTAVLLPYTGGVQWLSVDAVAAALCVLGEGP